MTSYFRMADGADPPLGFFASKEFLDRFLQKVDDYENLLTATVSSAIA